MVYASKRKNAAGQPVWRIVQWHEGMRHETTHAGTKREASAVDRALAARLALAPKGKPGRPRAAVCLSDFIVDTYQDHAKAHLAKSTWGVRRFQLDNIARHLGALKLTEIDTAAVERLKAARTTEGAKPGTVNTELAKLQAVLTYARALELPVASPKVRLLPVRGSGRVKFWTADQVSKLFAAVTAGAPELLPLVVFLANTGCRKGEALACEQSWIDLDADMIRIEPNAYWQPKDREPREIPIAPALRPFLKAALAKPGKYVFRSRDGDRWAFFPKLAFTAAVAAAGLTGGPHKLRHTFASHFLASCPDMFLLAQVLGQSHTRTTEIYSHLLPDHLEKARGVVNMGPDIGPAKLEARKKWATKK